MTEDEAKRDSEARATAHALIQGYLGPGLQSHGHAEFLPRLSASAPGGSPARLEGSSRSGSDADRALEAVAITGLPRVRRSHSWFIHRVQNSTKAY